MTNEGNIVANGGCEPRSYHCECCGKELDYKGRCTYCWIEDCECQYNNLNKPKRTRHNTRED